jgi:putative heme-binding domain-containing protein
MRDWIRQLPVRIDDAASIDRLISLDEATSLAREAEEGPNAAWQIAKRLAKSGKREAPNDEDVSAGKKQIAEQYAAAVKSRADERVKLTDELLAMPTRAVMLVDATRSGRLPPAIRQLVIASALRPNTDPAIRDLFESFIPEEQRTQRLGEQINPAELLKLTGDIERGRKLFHESTVVQCRTCHRIGGKGTEVGPDLDSIGKKYDRAKLLTSILQPSLEIDKKYTMWLVETKSGTVVTGLLVQRDDKFVVLRDAKNVLQRVPADDVDGIYPQTKSLMPEMLLRDFTAEQAADLLAYLSAQRADLPQTTSK